MSKIIKAVPCNRLDGDRKQENNFQRNKKHSENTVEAVFVF